MVDFRRALEEQRKALERIPHDRFTIAASGHRPDKLFGYDLKAKGWQDLGRLMRKRLKDALRGHGALDCVSGMALGVDQVFALVALKLRDEGSDIRVIAALPCRGQNLKWKSDEHWRNILDRADETVLVHDGPYTRTCMDERNKWMVRRSDSILAVWNGSGGGTCNCLRDAAFAKIPIDNLWEELGAPIARAPAKPGRGMRL